MDAVSEESIRGFILKAVRDAAGQAEDNYRRATAALAYRDHYEREHAVAQKAVERVERDLYR